MHVLVFDSKESLTLAVCSLWRDRLHSHPDLRLCLPSGNTPIPVYLEMAASVQRGHASFARCEIFALDEYGGLPADDPGRCSAMLRRYLLDKIDLPPHQFHPMPVEREDIEDACATFEADIAPGLDLVLLGLGLNGHLGLNEPGTAPDAITRRVEMHPESTKAAAAYVRSPALPTWGATIGLGTLLAAQEIWLLASGPAKAGIVKRVVSGAPDVTVPASWLKTHRNSWCFLDRAAAAELGLGTHSSYV